MCRSERSKRLGWSSRSSSSSSSRRFRGIHPLLLRPQRRFVLYRRSSSWRILLCCSDGSIRRSYRRCIVPLSPRRRIRHGRGSLGSRSTYRPRHRDRDRLLLLLLFPLPRGSLLLGRLGRFQIGSIQFSPNAVVITKGTARTFRHRVGIGIDIVPVLLLFHPHRAPAGRSHHERTRIP